MRKLGKIKFEYPPLPRSGDLAELIGVVLGDGHLSKFPRTEELSVFSNSKNLGFIKRYSDLIALLFEKKPAIARHGNGCTRIRIYQRNIQVRLGVPYSPRGKLKLQVPDWILRDETFIVRYLRGLYEAEGAYCVHLPTSTYKLFFSNKNTSLLKIVFVLMRKLGFHPHMNDGRYDVQLSKKEEVLQALELLQFRKY